MATKLTYFVMNLIVLLSEKKKKKWNEMKAKSTQQNNKENLRIKLNLIAKKMKKLCLPDHDCFGRDDNGQLL